MRLPSSGGHDVRGRTKEFAKRVVKLCTALRRDRASDMIGYQLLRCGCSVGAQVAEANYAKSRADFISKLEGALQELEESRFWMELLGDTNLMKATRLEALHAESNEITAIIVTIVNKTRRGGKA